MALPATAETREFANFADNGDGTTSRFVQSPFFLLYIDEASASVIYVGQAKIGSLASQAVWMIQRITIAGSITTISFADGNANFDNVWNNRASLTYS
jgi:hypothetical protein